MPAEELLLKWQRNGFFRLIQQQGLDPASFEWRSSVAGEEGEQYEVVELRMRGTPYYLSFPPGFGISHQSPGDLSVITWFDAPDWESLMRRCERWLENLKREIETPDLWAGIRDQLAGAEVAASDDNTPFTPEEQIRVRASLRDVLTQLQAQQELAAEQIAVVANRVEYLIDASTRMGRKDWANIVIGTLASWSMAAVLPPDAGRAVINLIWGAIQWAVIGHPRLPAS